MIRSFSGENRFLSNFWPVYVTYSGIQYPSVEHAYQAAKSIDLDYRLLVQQAKTANEAKTLGKSAILRDGWDDMKLFIMTGLLEQKFRVPYLRIKLIQTDGELVEGNYWHDTYWGFCWCKNHMCGENMLGKLLMEIREGLKHGS